MTQEVNKAEKKSFETICGIALAICAGVLALANLGGNNCDLDGLKAYADKTSAYQWYSTKGIKEELAEGARQTLVSLLNAGTIASDHAENVRARIRELEADAKRFGKEGREILEGSERVGKSGWVQDIDGKLGKVIGAKEFDAKAAQLAESGDIFDLAALFLQLSLIMGALSIVLQTTRLKWSFFGLLIVMGMIGSYYCAVAYLSLA